MHRVQVAGVNGLHITCRPGTHASSSKCKYIYTEWCAFTKTRTAFFLSLQFIRSFVRRSWMINHIIFVCFGLVFLSFFSLLYFVFFLHKIVFYRSLSAHCLHSKHIFCVKCESKQHMRTPHISRIALVRSHFYLSNNELLATVDHNASDPSHHLFAVVFPNTFVCVCLLFIRSSFVWNSNTILGRGEWPQTECRAVSRHSYKIRTDLVQSSPFNTVNLLFMCAHLCVSDRNYRKRSHCSTCRWFASFS